MLKKTQNKIKENIKHHPFYSLLKFKMENEAGIFP